jgi:phage terminase small subunit
MAVAGNPIAKNYWDHYIGNASPGHLMPIDAPLLARLCMCLARADDAEQKMGGSMIVKAPHTGVPMQSPWMAIVNRQTHLARQLASELALPPAQRNRLGVNDAPDPGDVAESYFR